MIKIDVKASCEKIKQKCEEQRITARQLQEHLGVEVTAPYIWLNGKGLPKLETLINLCDLLKCRVDDLIVTDITDSVSEDETLLNQPYYNKDGRKECWDEMMEVSVMGTALFDLWNAYKYLYRAGDKVDNSREQDIKKARNYINHATNIYTNYGDSFYAESQFAFEDMMSKVTAQLAKENNNGRES